MKTTHHTKSKLLNALWEFSSLAVLLAIILMAMGSCKDEKKEGANPDGYHITGTIKQSPDASLAVLTYKQNDSTYRDSSVVTQGKFSFQGKVAHPVDAMILLRHGNSFPETEWQADTFHFFIENSEMVLTANDSIKKANLTGSRSTAEAEEIDQKISPFTAEIIALYDRMDGRSKEERLMTHDTIQMYVDSIRTTAHNFIMTHPDSYIALQRFQRHEMPKNFDPIEAEKNFNSLFGEELQQTKVGKAIAEKISIAKNSQLGKEAPDFTQKTPEGEDFRLSSLRGKYVLVDFWAAWCKPCRAENPFVVKAYNKYKDKNFEIVGVSLDADKGSWVAAIEKDGLPWIHVSDLKHWKNEVALQYDINSVPANVLINPDGIIIDKNLRGEALTEKLSEIFPN
ncbi:MULTISPECIES: TlpA disulfide reductase family protein [unclassified Leeuwenhoekiella]|uniref:TlpA disulfide reductase family protein n=1 Tax=unclassified Leeuwenhoekiella TaxID=2615029 RepID=UPI000C5BD6E8|nr:MULTISPECIES: TlpA disulfide reductase family protein [unclassified Leeuwenhoekiella]MAW95412.1 thioredoxin [Leeuwenhoekiella sp.]MBA80799.1 thioredoxin [Leeuwenhoekiella sp.]|tara:strand:- start:71463 stop:72653 length:1191 start_codon:yes stop_codon:yes gene_type:complete